MFPQYNPNVKNAEQLQIEAEFFTPIDETSFCIEMMSFFVGITASADKFVTFLLLGQLNHSFNQLRSESLSAIFFINKKIF